MVRSIAFIDLKMELDLILRMVNGIIYFSDMKQKFGINQYEKSTPAKWRKLGDALLAVSTFITTYAAVEEIKWLIITSVCLGAAGKFFTNLFSQDEESN